VPFESAVSVSSTAQLAVHGPANDDAHSTVATLPGCKLVQTNTPFGLKGADDGQLGGGLMNPGEQCQRDKQRTKFDFHKTNRICFTSTNV
jgi:hypothetical protein